MAKPLRNPLHPNYDWRDEYPALARQYFSDEMIQFFESHDLYLFRADIVSPYYDQESYRSFGFYHEPTKKKVFIADGSKQFITKAVIRATKPLKKVDNISFSKRNGI